MHSASGPIRDAADSAIADPVDLPVPVHAVARRVPAFHEFIGILGPLLGIAFGFDAINGERSHRTLPRLVSQPIHRDEIINGKFVAGIGAIALGARRPHRDGRRATARCASASGRRGRDVIRIVAFFVVAVVYISLWLALAILLSVTCRRAATAALAAIADVARAARCSPG